MRAVEERAHVVVGDDEPPIEGAHGTDRSRPEPLRAERPCDEPAGVVERRAGRGGDATGHVEDVFGGAGIADGPEDRRHAFGADARSRGADDETAPFGVGSERPDAAGQEAGQRGGHRAGRRNAPDVDVAHAAHGPAQGGEPPVRREILEVLDRDREDALVAVGPAALHEQAAGDGDETAPVVGVQFPAEDREGDRRRVAQADGKPVPTDETGEVADLVLARRLAAERQMAPAARRDRVAGRVDPHGGGDVRFGQVAPGQAGGRPVEGVGERAGDHERDGPSFGHLVVDERARGEAEPST